MLYYFLTDVGLFRLTLWHVHAMVFVVSSIFSTCLILHVFFNISEAFAFAYLPILPILPILHCLYIANTSLLHLRVSRVRQRDASAGSRAIMYRLASKMCANLIIRYTMLRSKCVYIYIFR